MKFVKLSDKEMKDIASFYQGVMATAYEGLFYREGRVIGEGILEMVKDQDNILAKASKLIPARGWAEDMSFDEDKITVKGSIEVDDGAGTPTCHRLRGILATVYEKHTGEIVDIKETKCKSNGDPHCEFVLEKRGF